MAPANHVLRVKVPLKLQVRLRVFCVSRVSPHAKYARLRQYPVLDVAETGMDDLPKTVCRADRRRRRPLSRGLTWASAGARSHLADLIDAGLQCQTVGPTPAIGRQALTWKRDHLDQASDLS